MKLTERIRRPAYGRMEIEITVDDPKAYTRPWTVPFVQTIASIPNCWITIVLRTKRTGNTFESSSFALDHFVPTFELVYSRGRATFAPREPSLTYVQEICENGSSPRNHATKLCGLFDLR